jgi:molybdenum cofactor biosynthesis protein B
VIDQRILPDDAVAIRDLVATWAEDDAIQAILTTGGTGIAGRDTTYEALVSLLDKRIDGFGELFRMLSFAEVGSAAMLSRAVGGLAGRTVILAMPGSPAGVALAMDRLVIPELGHLAGEAARG